MQFKLPLEYKVLLTEAALEDLHLKAGVTSPLDALADLDLVDDRSAHGGELLPALGALRGSLHYVVSCHAIVCSPFPTECKNLKDTYS